MKIHGAVLRKAAKPQPYAQSRPLEIEEFDLAPPGPREVLVKIMAASLCHSDLSTINGDRRRQVPMVLGHEAAGVVVDTGPGVSDLRAGDHVVLVFSPSCGECAACKEGLPQRCEPGQQANGAGTLLGGAIRLSQHGQLVYHHVGCSAFATHAVVNRGSLVKVDDALPFAHAALFGCGVLTGVGAALNTAKVFPGASVAVVGLGGVGFNAMFGAQAAGASQVIAVDLHDDKLELAKTFGATATVNASDPDAIAKVKALTNGGVDFGLEMAGSVHAMELAYRLTRRGGTTVTAGLPHPDARWQLQHVNLTAEERTVKGSYMGSCCPPRDMPRYIEMFRRGALPVDRLMSDTLTLDRINEGFDALASGHTVRQVILFD
ncbi:MAG: zinc-dependent alcohol dehydrogenase family protein [Burkholderiales bacterium]|nr:zinc-dependent alcohol dehydrogenase family protein [Burkholderiales bacterium]